MFFCYCIITLPGCGYCDFYFNWKNQLVLLVVSTNYAKYISCGLPNSEPHMDSKYSCASRSLDMVCISILLSVCKLLLHIEIMVYNSDS